MSFYIIDKYRVYNVEVIVINNFIYIDNRKWISDLMRKEYRVLKHGFTGALLRFDRKQPGLFGQTRSNPATTN